MPPSVPALFLLVASLAGAASCGGGDAEVEATAPTYYADIKPIFDAKCVHCHGEGGLGPFPLTDYDYAFGLRGAIAQAVTSRVMPPWLAAPGCADYAADASLSDAQIAAVAAWVEAGAPEGDAASEGPPLDVGPSLALSRVDLTLALPEAYVASPTEDDYRCFVIDWPEEEKVFVTGFRTNPDDAGSVHHAIAFVAAPGEVGAVTALDAAEPGPGYTCYGGPLAAASWLGVFTPGVAGADFPAGTGISVEPGSKIILQVHYSPLNGAPRADRTSIDLKLDAAVNREAWIQPWFDPSWYGDGVMAIDAGESDVSVSVAYDPTVFVTQGRPVVMHTAGLHMHALGKSGKLSIQREGGEDECLLDIPRWDFHWQGAYAFATPKVLRPGDRIYQECHWDNTQENQPFVSGKQAPPHDVDWGEAAADEMCLGGFYLTLE